MNHHYFSWIYKAQHGGGGVGFSLELGVHLHPGAGGPRTVGVLSAGGAELGCSFTELKDFNFDILTSKHLIPDFDIVTP